MNDDYIYLKIIDNKVQAFSNLYTLKNVTGSESYDLKVLSSEWNGKCILRNNKIILDDSFKNKKQTKINQIASERYNEEVKGITYIIRGVTHTVSTNRESRASLRTLIDECKDNKNFKTTTWKFADGSFEIMTLDDLIQMSNAISRYVQSLFNKEADLVNRINKSINTAQLNEIQWNN